MAPESIRSRLHQLVNGECNVQARQRHPLMQHPLQAINIYFSAIPASNPAIADNGVHTVAAMVSLTFASSCQITP